MNKLFFSIILLGSISFSSCKEKRGCTDPNSITYDSGAEEDDGSCKYAGVGGLTTIVAAPEHHGESIFGIPGYVDSAFVKFNTQEFPGLNPALYDLVVPGEVGEEYVHIEGLKPGKYFIMMTGFDTTINERVIGAIPYVLIQSSGEVEVAVPVVE